MQGDQFSSFVKFKQSENWKSPKRQAMEESWVRRPLPMMEGLMTEARPALRRNTELGETAALTQCAVTGLAFQGLCG